MRKLCILVHVKRIKKKTVIQIKRCIVINKNKHRLSNETINDFIFYEFNN